LPRGRVGVRDGSRRRPVQNGQGRRGARSGELGAVAATGALPSSPRGRARRRTPSTARSSPTATSAARKRLLPAHRLLPSWRLIGAAWVAAALAAGAYAFARETSVFAIRTIAVEGAPAPLAEAVRRAVSSYRGASLVSLDGSAVLGRVEALPSVSSARYDRAFPNTLRIVVRAERPVAVLRAGAGSWLVSANARVLKPVPRTSLHELPRIWVRSDTRIVVGATLASEAGGAGARALAPLARAPFPSRIAAVTLARGELSFVLAGGVELRLGRPDDLRLKLAVARRIVRVLPAGTAYLDVSVPQRPVSGNDSQVSG